MEEDAPMADSIATRQYEHGSRSFWIDTELAINAIANQLRKYCENFEKTEDKPVGFEIEIPTEEDGRVVHVSIKLGELSRSPSRRCRISWKSLITGFTGHGDWFAPDCDLGFKQQVKDMNNDKKLAGMIYHWVEYE